MANNLYKTRDLYEASFLYANGQRLIRLEGDKSQKWFIFADKGACEKLAQTFWAKDSSVDAKSYAEAIRSLKEMIFARK